MHACGNKDYIYKAYIVRDIVNIYYLYVQQIVTWLYCNGYNTDYLYRVFYFR
jgi:hypothetical protein